MKEPHMEKIKILIDTDLGDDTDDTAALMLALNCPRFDIAGITTVYGDTKKRGRMVKDILALWDRTDIPVHIGRGRALLEEEKKILAPPIQYDLVKEKETDTEPVSETAAAFILEMVKREPELVILEMGCMTNLALAFLQDAESMRRAKIIAMGGAFFNATPEWNIACDPEAASIVVENAENLTMMGLDVTKYTKAGPERLEQWRNRGSGKMDYYLEGVSIFQRASGYPVTLHDVLLVAYLLDPEVVTLRRGLFSVELSGHFTRGTMVDRTNYYEIEPKVPEGGLLFAEKIDSERFWNVVEQYF